MNGGKQSLQKFEKFKKLKNGGGEEKTEKKTKV